MSGRPKFLPVRKVDKIETSPIAINIPYMVVDYDTPGCPEVEVDPDDFKAKFQVLKDEGVREVILVCRSGNRSTDCAEAVLEVFDGADEKVYEIDRPDKNGRGGLQGTSYSNNYNGSRGFPGRATRFQEYESASWSDAGLPVHVGACPAGP